MYSRITARAFLDKFLTAYAQCRSRMDDALWQATWGDTDRWSRHILYTPSPDSVLKVTADLLGVEYWAREPLHLDGVYWPRDPRDRMLRRNTPIPILVALEHENEVRVFPEEIAKLFCIRCPLKVGITYVLQEGKGVEPDAERRKTDIVKEAVALGSAMSRCVAEDPTSEYLYLLGVERQVRQLEWVSYAFTAASGPGSGNWKVAA
jgi:hypothetical protein